MVICGRSCRVSTHSSFIACKMLIKQSSSTCAVSERSRCVTFKQRVSIPLMSSVFSLRHSTSATSRKLLRLVSITAHTELVLMKLFRAPSLWGHTLNDCSSQPSFLMNIMPDCSLMDSAMVSRIMTHHLSSGGLTLMKIETLLLWLLRNRVAVIIRSAVVNAASP